MDKDALRGDKWLPNCGTNSKLFKRIILCYVFFFLIAISDVGCGASLIRDDILLKNLISVTHWRPCLEELWVILYNLKMIKMLSSTKEIKWQSCLIWMGWSTPTLKGIISLLFSQSSVITIHYKKTYVELFFKFIRI